MARAQSPSISELNHHALDRLDGDLHLDESRRKHRKKLTDEHVVAFVERTTRASCVSVVVDDAVVIEQIARVLS